MAKLTKFKAQKVEFPTDYRIEDTNRGDNQIKRITPEYGNVNEPGTPETVDIYDGMQLGSVHTLQAVKSTNLGIDYYSCNLDGLTEFGLKTDLKIRLTINSENGNNNPKLRLNNIEYTLLKEFNGTLKALESNDLKQNKTYELTYNGSQFIVINIEEINYKTWLETIGGQFGGYVSKIANKEAGKLYINDVYDNKLYVCVTAHSSTSFDITKYRDITNNGISNKLENLSEVKQQTVNVNNGYLKFIKTGKIVSCFMFIHDNNGYNLSFSDDAALATYPSGFEPKSEYTNTEFPLSTDSRNNLNGETRMVLRATTINLFGTVGKNFKQLKGTATYSTN